MSTTTSTTDTLDRVSLILGTAMMIAWMLAIGNWRLCLILAIAFGHDDHSNNLAVVASCLLFFASSAHRRVGNRFGQQKR